MAVNVPAMLADPIRVFAASMRQSKVEHEGFEQAWERARLLVLGATPPPRGGTARQDWFATSEALGATKGAWRRAYEKWPPTSFDEAGARLAGMLLDAGADTGVGGSRQLAA